MSWSITAEANVRDIKPALEAARDEWIVLYDRDVASDEAKQQVRAAITATEVLVLSGCVGVGGVLVAISGTAGAGLNQGTVSIAVSDVPEELSTIGPASDRVYNEEALMGNLRDEHNRPIDNDDSDNTDVDEEYVETDTKTEPKGETNLPAVQDLENQLATKAEEAREQVDAGVRDESFLEHLPTPGNGDDVDDPGEASKASLQDQLRERGLPTSGNKAELQARLDEDGRFDDGTSDPDS